jgi:hypothetical protein
MRKFNRSKKVMKGKKHTNAKKVTYDGILFASGLEVCMYKLLKNAGIESEYEGESFELQPKFNFPVTCYERQGNGKGSMVNRGDKNVAKMSYTPDFIGKDFVIEVKGFGTDSFKLRWKLFKYLMRDRKDIIIYKPQRQSECADVVDLILKNRKIKSEIT